MNSGALSEMVKPRSAPLLMCPARVPEVNTTPSICSPRREVTAGDDHPLRVAKAEESGEAIPYILIRDRLEARVLRAVFYQLVEAGEENGEQFGVWSSGRFFPLGRLDPAG